MGFTQGLSGLNAASRNLTTIGNNIANSQTVGYKSGRTEFADMFAGSVGLGVKVADISRNFTGGSLQSTGRDLDLAINGEGFFRLSQGNQVVYSRNGQFHRTKEGYIANAQGAMLTGYNVQNFNSATSSPTIAASGNPEAIQLPTLGLNARATNEAMLTADLDAGADIPINATFDPADSDSFNWSSPFTIYDSLGNAHNLNLYFGKTATNNWEVHGRMMLGDAAQWSNTMSGTGTYPGTIAANLTNGGFAMNGEHTETVAGGTYKVNITGATFVAGAWTGGTVTYTQTLGSPIALAFDTSGNLDTVNGANGSLVNMAFNAQNGSNPITFSFDFDGTTQTAQKFRASGVLQDGYGSGDLVDIAIQDSGMVRGIYSNGETINLAQLSMARFASNQGLQPVGDNAWVETGASGQAVLGLASQGQFGTLRGGTLEGSNVDLSKQLVKMIIAQRTYQANAQTIKTQSQVMQTAVNMAR